MTEYAREDRNGNELKVGDKVVIYSDGIVVGKGVVTSSPFPSSWALENDIVWIAWTWADQDRQYDLGRVVWSETCKVQKEPTPHPHAELIKMWADDPSIEIQWFNTNYDSWVNTNNPSWCSHLEYRIKPKEKKVVTKYKYSLSLTGNGILHTGDHYSDEEWVARLEKHPVKHFTKLEWTKKEFEVEG